MERSWPTYPVRVTEEGRRGRLRQPERRDRPRIWAPTVSESRRWTPRSPSETRDAQIGERMRHPLPLSL